LERAAVVLDFAQETIVIEGGAMAMGMQLHIDAGGGEGGRFLWCEEMQHARPTDFGVGGGDTGGDG
jgi:hypothetical protein